MATTYTTYLDKPKYKKEWVFSPSHKLVRVAVNFALQTLDASASDVQQLITVPANTMVLRCWPVVTTSGTANASIDIGYGGDADFWGNAVALDNTGCNTILFASTTWDAGSIADGDEEAKEITVDGAALGDSVISVNHGVDVADLAIVAQVTAANTVTAQLGNWTGGAIDLASTTTQVYVDKAIRGRAPFILSATAADTIDITATVNAADADPASGVVEIYAELLSLTGSF